MIKTELEDLISPLIKDLGYELWGCEYLSQGKYSLLRIYIDKEGGIVLEDCEKVSQQVSALLDVEDPIAGNYSLEISSPGIPKPLFYSWQYQRYIGQQVQLKLIKPVNRQKKFTGIIVSASEDKLVLNLEHEQQEILISNIAKANLTV
jgi:ribosome maturation factor RimP